MSRRRFHGLRRLKFRMTWNKYNLYNLSRMTPSNYANFGATYFQQKWAAKAATRAYHGEQIREKQWERMFTPRLNAAIPMDHRYLGEHDGSELAAGRGSGLEKPFDPKKTSMGKNQVPYMHMTYAPAERRLDVAIFRALFASSARQARQFVTHGKVKVNGKKMPYPGYLLNPGDMFQVDPERVLFATGQAKTPEQVKAGREILRRRRIANTRRDERKKERKEKALQEIANKKVSAERAAEPAAKPVEDRPVGTDKEARKQRKNDLQELGKQIKAIMENRKAPPPAKRKQELRALNKEIKATMSLINRRPATEIQDKTDDLTAQLTKLYVSNPLARFKPTSKPEVTTPEKAETPAASQAPEESPEEKKQLREAMMLYRENPIDESKPYATPWAPRPYMSAFAFIPRYLEVNHNICSAVYLRHPVAKPGLAEVPTPFNAEVMQLAFNWYLRRR
ncbi:37S ribosomal protein NAM9 [Lachnellula suecica]|uniref:Small ribosomal subunit protein uS4m n=1 Tax=Lachnellula suecica TaxID=602035 RepID=A0A8T9BVT1_9HELO|nr:37S ribosomal protein NAM9 [Lachnellula suecica]